MKHLTKSVSIFFFIVAVGACSTVPVAQREDRIEVLIMELQTSDRDRLMELSARPFLLDGEILMRENDIATLWRNLENAGFRFDGAEIRSITPITTNSYRQFAETMDVQVFFDRYLPEDAGLVEIGTDFGSFLILTGDKVRRIPRLVGFTGPQ